MSDPYDYPVLAVKRVVDGDTVDLVVGRNIGFHVTASATIRFRLLDVDTPERGKPGYVEAADFVKLWLENHHGKVRCSTHKDDSFGRWLAYVYVLRADGTADSLNDALLAGGYAVPYAR